jgi:hypothetical protein
MESTAGERPQYCDIVMKGGITSGVVYPLAAVELAKDHQFRNVGGTSAGAIAAAAVAAAEHGRRSGRNPSAYDHVAALPDWLGKEMISLFQPSARSKPLFDVLLASLSDGRAAIVTGALRAFAPAAALGALPGLVLFVLSLFLDGGAPLRVIAALLALGLVAVGVVAAVLLAAALRVRDLPDSYFGLCPGNDRDEGAASPPLTRWLADLIDKLAGKDDGPLTFGDLWALDAADGERGVNLQMMTSNLSQGRPYSLPFEAGEQLWFDEEEFLDLFPARVVSHMVDSAEDVGPAIDGPAGRKLLPLPAPAEMPVVVAARMSLSFPVLIGAVPLYAINHAPKVVSAVPERCWFSDGGITSNFPVHFFDSPIPRWPTFAIDLIPLTPDRRIEKDECDNVWLPSDNTEGVAEAWVGWEGEPPFKRLGAFANSIFRTAQNWIDNRQLRGAGYRDRIAHVRLGKGEGGMNLKMEEEDIKRLAARGACAARILAERFAPEPPPGTVLSWDNQRWIRYRTYMELLERQGREAACGYRDDSRGTSLEGLGDDPPSFPWASDEQGKFARAATAAQMAAFEDWQGGSRGFGEGAPQPGPEPWSIPRV